MAETIKAWQKRLGYSLFAAFALVLGLVVTFPYDTLKDRIRLEADGAGLYVRIGSIGPGFFALRAKNVEVAKKAEATADTAPEALMINSLSVRPSLFPLGVALSANLLGGNVDAKLGGLGDFTVKLDVDNLDPSQGNFKALTGIDMSGTLDANVNLSMPRTQIPGSKAKEPDLSAANGTITLNGNGLTVNGGTVNVPMMGEMTPMDLPKIAFGDLNGRLVVEKGQGTLEEFQTKSEDVEIRGEGTLRLARRLPYSEPKLKVKIKANPDFVKRLGLVGSGLSMLPSDPQDRDFRVASITGFLNRPNFTPGGR